MRSKNGVQWLGEFLVVVLGILGAFAIEDWSERRADRTLELAYLEQLQRDLQADDAEMDENRLAALQRAMSVGQVMEQAGLELAPLPSLAFGAPLDLSDTLAVGPCPALTSCLMNYRTYDGSRAAYDELVNTGNIRVVRNRSLVRALAVYHARMLSEQDADLNLGRADAPVRGDAQLRALLLQVHYGASWQIRRIETMARLQLRDLLDQIETELADAN